jgi:hypothetical protein
VVTEPGVVARAKKNGLDYLFHLYEQCRAFLLQVQTIAKMGGHKSPTKVRVIKLRQYVKIFISTACDQVTTVRKDFYFKG